MSLWPLKFDDIFKISTTAMHFNGTQPFVTVRNKLWLFKIYFFRIILSICFVFLVNSIISHDVKHGKFGEAVKNGSMAIVAVTAIFKHIILIHRRSSVTELINFIEKDYIAAEDFGSKEKEIVLKYAKEGIKICRFWLITGCLTCFIFPVEAFVLMAYYCAKKECHLIPMFDLTYPKIIEDYKDIFFIYCTLFLLCFSFGICSTSVYIGFDPLVPIFMLHTSGQINLICLQLSKALSESSNVQEMKENLKCINIRLTEIYGFVKKAQNIFVVLYEFNLKMTTFLIPFSGFQIAAALRRKEIPLDFIFFFIPTLSHFYLPCYYSDLLMEKSRSLRQAIYACGWELQPHIEIRKMILHMLIRTAKPLVIKTIFYPICLNTFAEMCRQAYAIYNIMNAAWAENDKRHA